MTGRKLDALRDAAEPSHHVRTHRCLVCGTTDRLTLTDLAIRDLAPFGLNATMPATVCVPHLEAALRRVGHPTPAGNANRCSGQHDHTDITRFGVVAVWPLRSVHKSSEATIRACRTHLARGLAEVAAARPQETVQ